MNTHFRDSRKIDPARGATLARLDLPAAAPLAAALFAHGFACGKGIAAARRIARRLAAMEIAVLRFDLTGLGHSEGEFANTSFNSTAVADASGTEPPREDDGSGDGRNARKRKTGDDGGFGLGLGLLLLLPVPLLALGGG